MLTVALAKGRLGEKALSILEKAGYDIEPVRTPARKLIIESDNMRFILVKPSDVPTYVESGVADIGIVGKDTLMESMADIYELLDLDFAKCYLAVAGFPEKKETWITVPRLRVATKYVNIAKEYFNSRGENIEIIKLNGSVELGPLIGLSDVIVDIVESGRTLRENGLDVLVEICPVSARLVANPVSLKIRKDEILPMIERIEKVLEKENK